MASSQNDRLAGLVANSAVKAPCKAATTANITLSGAQSIDGVSVTTGDRVLVKDQTDNTKNGIYVADTGTWSRALDCDGSYDLLNGSLVRINNGTTNAAAWFHCTSSDTITVGTSAITWARETINYVQLSSQTASSGQTVFTVPTYQTNANGIAVFVNGIRQRTGTDFTETDSTHITFVLSLIVNDEVDCYIGSSIGNLTAASASQSSVTDAADYYVGTNVEAVLQEIAQGTVADNGDASVTLTNNSSARVQRWNTALTVNRTVTLSTSNAKESATFYIVRGSGATGNFTLTVGGTLATLRAPGEWCRVVYSAGTTNTWVLAEYGILQSAEIRAVSADNGDAGVTLTVGSSERTQRWATALTADRTVTLSTTGAYSGARFLIVRTEAATGSFGLIVAGAATLLTLARGQWCVVEYSGTAWLVAEFGDIRPNATNVVRVFDDFLGTEIDGYRWQGFIGTDAAARHFTVRADQLRGMVRGTTGANASADMAGNGVQLQGALNWQANQGCLIFETRLTVDATTSAAVFAGFTNQDTALQIPVTGSGVADGLTNNANDAVGVLFDTTMTTKNWWLVGVKGGTGAISQNSAVAPVASTHETWRIELDASGNATFYRNGTLVGTTMTGAVTASVPLCPVIASFSRTSASRNIDIDFLAVQAQR